ncbi:MAG TPA: cobalamin biosynthesis protein CbiM [Anaerolineae bacterium]|nr:cobalamin biosynthesis protein CbiM [Anaerolineae bacterium]HIQ04510.1 cobalamin biosynthesis protein CbiM [Anaerolineae bacterium]
MLLSSVAAPLMRPQAMHIPDGFLSFPVLLVCWLFTIAALAVAIRHTNAQLGERQVPLMGVLAAFIFAGQMINFPVAGGTSGHLIGGTLAAILLGPWAAMLVMTAVVAVQALFFQDGGLIALGANILFMGVVAPLVGYWIYTALRNANRLLAAALAAWISVVVAAMLVSIALWLSGTIALGIVLPAMASVHALIGIGEALITAGALAFITATRPELAEAKPAAASGGRWMQVGLGIALVIALLSPLASSAPDGLERVAEDHDFLSRAMGPFYGIIPDYLFPGISNEALATIVAGIVGTLLLFALGWFLGRRLQRRTAS